MQNAPAFCRVAPSAPVSQTKPEPHLAAPFEKAARLQARFRLSPAGVVPTLKAGAFWLGFCLLQAAISAAWRMHRGKTVTADFIIGEALDLFLFGLFFIHLFLFKPRSTRAWAASWLIRFTLLFVSSCASAVARHGAGYHDFAGGYYWIGASVIATLTVLWQWDKQKQADKKAQKEIRLEQKR